MSISKIALKYLGVKQGTPEHKKLVDDWNKKYGKANNLLMGYTNPWCAMFSSLMSLYDGMTSKNAPLTVGCWRIIDQAKKLGIWEERDDITPNVDDLIIYEWSDGYDYATTDCDYDGDHVGIVWKVANGKIYVVEGNKGDDHVVGKREIDINGRYIRGFVRLGKATKTPTKTPTKAPTKTPTTSKFKPYMVEITTNRGLYMRSGTSTDCSIVGAIPWGWHVKITKELNGWGYTTYNGVSGWCCLAYTKKV